MTDDWGPESGRRAKPPRIIERVRRLQERIAGVRPDGGDPRTLDWRDPDDRRMVREKFDGSAKRDEAILPGFGENGRARNARPDCGNPHPFICDSCGHSVEFGRTCSQSVCARCGAAWARDSSISKSAKVARIRKEKHQHTPEKEHQKIHHQIISPPLSFLYDMARGGLSLSEALEKCKEVVKVILDEQRAQGAVFRHSYRGVDDDGAPETDGARDDGDLGEWRARLYNRREWGDDVREDLAWMPHFHCIVVSDWLQGEGFSDVIESETGWVVHRITSDDDRKSLESDKDMARALTYCLSHTDIEVDPTGHNSTAAWWVGSFRGDIIKSDSRFAARPWDIDWADGAVREISERILGLDSGTTECGTGIPPVDDPEELARRVILDLYPDADPDDVDDDAVLHNVAEGNISIDVSAHSGGGGDVTVTDAWGEPIGPDGWGGDLPDAPDGTAADLDPEPVDPILDEDRDDGDGCDDGCDHGDDDRADDGERTCDGTLIPLEVARDRGLLDDDEWRADAPHEEEAREADDEWPKDLDPWRTESPGASVGVD